jgi:hypothetical protein
MIRNSSTFGTEKTPLLDVIYENLVQVFDENIHSFLQFKKDYELANKDLLVRNNELKNEDDITNSLSLYLNFDLPKNENQFHFTFQYKTIESSTSTDIGVVSLKYSKYKCICFIEAKRLPTPNYNGSEETEYVCYKNSTKKGGIERFKTEDHGGKENFPFSIMIAYIQKENATLWHRNVNEWIDKEIAESSNSKLSWFSEDKLIQNQCFSQDKITKYNSTHSRITLNKIYLTHYWIDLN